MSAKVVDLGQFDIRPIGIAIRQAREKAHMTRNELAEELQFSVEHLKSIENGIANPSVKKFYLLMTYFSLSVDQFFYPDYPAPHSGRRKSLESAINRLGEEDFEIVYTVADNLSRRIEDSDMPADEDKYIEDEEDIDF